MGVGVGGGREQATISGRINSQPVGAPLSHECLTKMTFWFSSGRPFFGIYRKVASVLSGEHELTPVVALNLQTLLHSVSNVSQFMHPHSQTL